MDSEDDSKRLVRLTIKDFKRFELLEVPLEKSIVVVSGPNGSGKSQVLWSIVLYCRAHNARFVDSQFIGHLDQLG